MFMTLHETLVEILEVVFQGAACQAEHPGYDCLGCRKIDFKIISDSHAILGAFGVCN